MANTDAPQGFTALRHLSGGTPVRNESYTIASGYNTNTFTGDAVKLVASGTIEKAAAGDRILGVFAGCEYTDAAGNPVFAKYWPADTVATDIKAYVYDDPNTVFEVQSAGTAVETNIGNLADHVTGTGSTSTGRSGAELSGTMGTGAAGFRIIGIVNRPDNSYGANANLEVMVYEHEFSRNDPATPGV